jgi:hypothetical protein
MAHERFELRDKVEFRKKQLSEALDRAESEKLPDERIVGLRTELSLVEDALSGGWENVSEVTAAQLSGWLESTKYLVENASGKVPETERATRPQMPTLAEKSNAKQSDDKVGKPMAMNQNAGATAGSPRSEQERDPQREVVDIHPRPKNPDISGQPRSKESFDNPVGLAPNGTRR